MTRQLNKTVVAGGVVYSAGTTATPELEARITNPDHWDGDPATESGGYSGWSKSELEAEAAKRDVEVTGKGTKADLIAALEASDQD